MKIIISAGHNKISDPGAIYGEWKEAEITMKIRDQVLQLMPWVVCPPDDLYSGETVQWINERATKDCLAVDIHLNMNRNPLARGTEGYYDNEPELAEMMARNVASIIGTVNRGAKHESESYLQHLGFLERLKCSSTLIEVCYLSNELDRNIITTERGQTAAAVGIRNGIREYLGFMQSLLMKIEELKAKIKQYAR